MNNLANYNYSPPKHWQDFETLCRDLWREIWKDPNTQKNGRSGQKQHGVDVYGQPNRGLEWAGVQCKGKDNTYNTNNITEKELLKEVKEAKGFEPPLSEWVLATTAPRDVEIGKKVRKLSSKHQREDIFTVHIWFWEDIVEELVKYPNLVNQYLLADYTPQSEIVNKLENTMSGIKDLTSISAQQTNILENNSLFIEAISKTLDTVQQIRTQDILVPYLNAEIDDIRDQINEFQYQNAIKALEKLKSRIWSNAPDLIKFRILSSLGSAFYGINKTEDAGRYFKEAYPYNPDDENSLVNLALAYSFQSDDENTKLYAERALSKNPDNINAYSILLQTSPCKSSLENCLVLVPENLRDVGVISFCIGLAAQVESNFSQALDWFEKAVSAEPENPVFKGYLGAMLIQSLWNDKSALLYGQATKKEKKVLNRAVQILSEAFLKVENTDLQKPNVVWLVNRGIAKKLLGRTDDALQDLRLAHKIDSEDPQIIKHLALIILRTKDFPNAAELLEKIKTNSEIPEASIFLADFYNSNDKPDEAIEVINEFLVWNKEAKFDLLARRILIDVYVRTKQTEKAQTAAEKLIEDFPHEPTSYFESAKATYSKKTELNAKQYLETAKQLITDKTPVPDIGEIGDAFFGLKMYRDAADCYEKIADPEQDSFFTNKLLNAYYYAGTLSGVLSICRNIRERYGIVRHYARIEIWSLEEVNDLKQEVAVAEKYLDEFPDDLEIKIKLAQISFLLEDYAKTDEIISENFDVDELPLETGITISSLLALRSNIQKSFDLMYELRRKHFDQAEIHSYYQANFYQANNKDLEWMQNDVVSGDTAVCVEGIDGQKKWFIIEDREAGDLAKGEFNINHSVIVGMLGRKVGDEIQLKPSVQNAEIGRIIEIKNKLVFAAQETAKIYETAFPERKDFKSIYVGEPDAGESQNSQEKIREMLADKSAHSQKGLAYYRQQPLTIGMLGKFLGLDGLEIWNRLLIQSEISVITSSGDINLLQDTINLLTKEEPSKLVADVTSLQLMYELNVGEEIIAHFGKLLVAPTTMHSLSNIIREKERNLLTGQLNLLERNGQLYKDEISPEQVATTVKHLKNFQSWVKNNTEILPYQSGFDVDRKQKADMRETFLPEFYDSIMTVKKGESLIFSEDLRLRQFAQNQFGIQGVWMQPVLTALKSKNVLTREKYNAALVKLLISNLNFINVDAISLFEVAKTLDWAANDYFKRAVNRLRGPESEFTSSLTVAATFLLLLAKENINRRAEESLVICLLEGITEGRNLQTTLYGLFKLIDFKFIFLPFGRKRLIEILKFWRTAQIFKMKGLILPL